MRQYLTAPKAFRETDPVILIDSREQLPYEFPDMTTEVVCLGAGDYSVKGLRDLAIERKSLPDFVGCCGQSRERFLRELKRLQSYRWRAIVIESSWAEIRSGEWPGCITPQHVRGAILSWSIEFGIPIILAGNRSGGQSTVRHMLVSVARHRHEEWREFIRTDVEEAAAAETMTA